VKVPVVGTTLVSFSGFLTLPASTEMKDGNLIRKVGPDYFGVILTPKAAYKSF
jgi:hypothetical protein